MIFKIYCHGPHSLTSIRVFFHTLPPPPTFPFLFLQTLCLQSCPIVLPGLATLWPAHLPRGIFDSFPDFDSSSPGISYLVLFFFVTSISQQRARARKLLMSARRRPRPERLMRESAAEGVPSTNSLIIGARPLPGGLAFQFATLFNSWRCRKSTWDGFGVFWQLWSREERGNLHTRIECLDRL